MKVPIDWLNEYVDVKDLPTEELAEKLSLSGSEVEHIIGVGQFDKVVVGEVLEVKKHPNADKLNVAKVDVGKELLQIVCGAPNLKKGQKVPVATVGAKLGDFQIGKANLRGIESSGMICSEKELDLGEDHSGIMVLDKQVKAGTPFGKLMGKEVVLDLDITPNRVDCFSIMGIAREVATVTKKELDLDEIILKELKDVETEALVEIEVKSPELCPRYVARVVKDVKVGPSPDWMQKRLIACGMRPINNLVDISNYVMLEFGQPLHFFDLAKVQKGKKAKIIVRKAEKGETLRTLDGTERKLDKEMLVIADGSKPLAVAGIMGGESSEVDENTKDVLIEAAVFDKTSIRKASRNLGLRTEASTRFEKGLPLTLPEVAVDRAAQLLQELGKGKVASGKVDVLSKWIWVQHIGVRYSRLKEILGVDIKREEVLDILTRLGFVAENFNVVSEAKKHLGKPYLWGANYKQNGTEAFDCGYLVDYMYSLIGHMVGHTAPQIMEYGQEVELVNLQPGDVLFRNGKWEKVKEKDRNGVSHVAIYLGDGKIIHAEDHHRVDGEWVKYPQEEQKVRIDPLELITEDPHFIKATRLVEDLEDYIAVTVPWWRTDIRIEEDIFEEIGRIYGYRNFPLTVLKGALPKFEQNKSFALTNDIKTFLSGAGFTEVYNYSFISEGTLKKLGEKPEEVLEIENPLSPEYKYMRKELAGNLLNNLAKNQNEFERIAIFEIGTTFVPQKDLPKETKMLGIAVKNKSGMDGKTFYDLKGAVDFLFQKLNISDYFYRKEKIERMDGNRAVSIFVEGKKVGFLGEFSVQTENNFDLNSDSGICEINLDELLKHGSKVKEYSEISKFPKIIRDVSAIFGTGVEAGKLVAETAKLDKLIGRVEVIDIYQGKPLEKGERSITVRFEFQSMEKTLTDAEVDAIIIKINKKVSNLGGKIRGGEQS